LQTINVPLVAEHDLILVVADDESERQIVEGLLEKRGAVNLLRRDGSLDRFRHWRSPAALVYGAPTMGGARY
jgi:CheY-like chemotaxis protein